MLPPTSPPDPWSYLASLPDVRLVWADLPTGVRGLTNGTDTIWLARGMSQRERRVALTHELVHHYQRHTAHQPPAVERRVEIATARLLLPDLDAVAVALAACPSMDTAAEELWVTRRTLADRLGALTEAERAHIVAKLA